MIKRQRTDIIMSELAKRGSVSVRELSEMLNVSSATIRRDIAELDDKTIDRTHGGISLGRSREEPAYDDKLTAYLKEKRRIGAMAADLLESEMCVGCGGGTTVMQMIHALKFGKSLRIVTTAANVALELRDAKEIEVILTGGTMRHRTSEMIGHIAERTLADINLDVAILGVDGLDPAAGLTTYDFAEAFVNRVLISRAKSVWVLADQSKVLRTMPAVIAPLSSVTRLIVNRETPEESLDKVRHHGVEVLLA